MTIRDINDIIKAVCSNSDDYEKPYISPKYLRQKLEQLALEQEQRMLYPTIKNDLALFEKTYADLCNCEGGEGWLKMCNRCKNT